jgi:hypothetical protein
MKTYIVLTPIKNVRTGESFAKGATVELDSTNGQVRAWLHFGQIEEKPDEKADEADSKGKGKGKDKGGDK